jgi:hypothetical protein
MILPVLQMIVGTEQNSCPVVEVENTSNYILNTVGISIEEPNVNCVNDSITIVVEA